MQVAIGLIQIAAGLLLGFSIMVEYRENGALIQKARAHDEPVSPVAVYSAIVLVASLLGGGLYLLKPANLCGL